MSLIGRINYVPWSKAAEEVPRNNFNNPEQVPRPKIQTKEMAMKLFRVLMLVSLALPAFAGEACFQGSALDTFSQLRSLSALKAEKPKEVISLPQIEEPAIEIESPTLKVAMEPQFPKLRKPRKDNYQVILHVPQGMVQEMSEGVFPSVYASGKTEEGWKKREDASVTVRKVGNIFDVYVTTSRKPTKDAVVAVNLNGAVFPIENRFLVLGAERNVELPKELKSSDYKLLHQSFPKRQSLLAKVISPAMQLGPQVGFSILSGSPIPLAYSVFNMTARRAVMKKSVRARALADQEQIQMLRQEVGVLQGQLAQLQQTSNQQTLAQRQ